jgi:hypothetical protein
MPLEEIRPGKVSPAGRKLNEEGPNGFLPRFFEAGRLLVQQAMRRAL